MNCFHIAAVHGHLDICKTIIDEHDFHVHLTDDDVWTTLHYSAAGGNNELIIYFTDMGTDTELKQSSDRNCLQISALFGHLNICKVLIDKCNFDIHKTDSNR